MSVYKVMKREDIIIRLAVLIFMGGGLNTSMIFLAVLHYAEQNPSHLSQNEIPFITAFPELTILYLGVGIGYSIMASITFVPKRIVSPLYVQFVTATILIIAINTMWFFQNPDTQINRILLETELVLFFMVYTMLFMAGWLQGWIVKKVLGINGTEENIYEKTYHVNCKFEKISKVLLDKHFLSQNKLGKKQSLKDELVLQTSYHAKEKHALVLASDIENKNSCHFTLTSYLIKHDWLRKPDSITGHESLIGVIERLAQNIDSGIKITETDDKDAYCRKSALAQALRQTNSPFDELCNYPKRPMILLGILLGILTGVLLGHFYHPEYIPVNAVLNAMIFLTLAIFVDVYSLIREKVESR